MHEFRRSTEAFAPGELGRRIAELRSKHGLTQQDLAARLAVSRAAVSHLEAGLSVPGERTVVLLASVFGVDPHVLVAGTSYPPAKADRLPVTVARYTEVEHQLALLEADLRWCEQVPASLAESVLDGWRARLAALRPATLDAREREHLEAAARVVGQRLAEQRNRGS